MQDAPKAPPSAMEMIKSIPSETAQQMFNAVRYHTESQRLTTMIPDLDEYILSKRNISLPSSRSSFKKGDIIEIQGPAAAGKTQFLYHLVATCILPSKMVIPLSDHSEQIIPAGGWQKSAVVLDCDGRWDVRRLHSILVTRVSCALSSAVIPLPHRPGFTTTSIILESLSRLHIFRPTSSLQLAATLLCLPQYHEEQMPREEIYLLVVDSIGASYWLDRWRTETSGSKTAPGDNPIAHVLQCIQAFRQSHGPITILTTWGLNALSPPTKSALSPSSPTFFKQHLASPFPSPFEDSRRHVPVDLSTFVHTFHITIPYTFIPPLQVHLKKSYEPGDTGLQEALRDDRRKDLVNTNGVRAYIRYPPKGRSHDAVFGRFEFRVMEEDVVAARV